jgi:sialic acid synthase SpsE
MEVVRKSVVAKVSIPKGTRITEEMITVKRPGHGIAPKYWSDVVGKKAAVDIEEDIVLTTSMIE